MRVAVDIRYSFEEAIRELGGDAGATDDVIAVETEDRLFVGGGCEAPIVVAPGDGEINVSVCALREKAGSGRAGA